MTPKATPAPPRARRNAKYTVLPADGPLPLEMVRSVPAIARDPLSFLERMVARYGDVVAFPMPKTPVLLANTPGAARHVLQQNHPNYTKATIQYGSLAAVTGQGLLTSDGENWRRHRRAVQPAFHPAGLSELASVTMRAAASPRHWAGTPAGPSGEQLVDADTASMRVMLDVVTACLFSESAGPDGERVINAVDAALHSVVAKARSPMVGPLARLPTPAQIRQRRAVATLDDACAALVARRRSASARNQAADQFSDLPGNGPSDLLGLLLTAQDDGILDGAEVRDELVTLIIAGYETVASSLAWTLSLIADDPAVQGRLHHELDRILGGPAGRDPGWDDLPALVHVRAVVQESLRLYPPAWVITRRATGPDEVAGVAIPAGTLVILSPWLLHRRSQEWPDPLRFNPERFIDAGESGSGPAGSGRREGYLPFGAGPRLCIGREVALMQATLVLARLLRDQTVRRPAGAVNPAAHALVTLRPKGGLPLILAPRPASDLLLTRF